MSIKMFDVLKPFIEIVIIVWISDFVLRRLNINISNNLSSNNWNAKKIVVLSLLFAFIIASLVLTQVTVYLKGVILVFIGIFIGVNLEAVKFVLGMLNVNRHLTDYDAREQ
jgi:hypothetical protein